MYFDLNHLSYHHFQSTNFTVINLIEIVYQLNDVIFLELHCGAMVRSKGIYYDLVVDYVVRAEKNRVTEC